MKYFAKTESAVYATETFPKDGTAFEAIKAADGKTNMGVVIS